MLELIVLGQVPGTDIYISFTEVALTIGILAATYALVSRLTRKLTKHRLQHLKTKIIEQQTI